ncbi:MAG: Fic family protein [Pseudohongiellaceae bacterium]|nr:Fic family protein [Pseudohongiellaceae bacterium]
MKLKTLPIVEQNPLTIIAEKCPEKLAKYLEFYSPIDHKGRYLHFEELRFRVPSDLDESLVWSVVSAARKRQQVNIIRLGEPSVNCNFVLTPGIQKAVSETDRNTTSASLEWISSKIGEKAQIDYLLKDLIEDESISSSQLEGAATTTSIAKNMLKKNRKPRNADERMILGNFRMMSFVWEHRADDLSIDLIRELHEIGVQGIDDDKYTPGLFRKGDDVRVVDRDEDVVHVPPSAANLKSRMKKIVDWANTDHSEVAGKSYIHPLIKAIVLHFCIGFEHPFNDGNGRVARALFYWYLFKSDFAAFRYIAISVLLKNAPIQYGKSFLYTESDSMDLTYFLEYQSKIIIRAIQKFKDAYTNAAREIEQFDRWLWDSGLYKKLNDKQITVFRVAKSGVALAFTARNVEHNLGCSYNTASAVLNGLVKLKLFCRVKEGREWVYYMNDKEEIITSWKKT